MQSLRNEKNEKKRNEKNKKKIKTEKLLFERKVFESIV